MRTPIWCEGGPLDGKQIGLACPQTGTLAFSCNKQKGRYVYVEQTKTKREFLKWETAK